MRKNKFSEGYIDYLSSLKVQASVYLVGYKVIDIRFYKDEPWYSDNRVMIHAVKYDNPKKVLYASGRTVYNACDNFMKEESK